MEYNVNFCSSKPVKLTAQKGEKLYDICTSYDDINLDCRPYST